MGLGMRLVLLRPRRNRCAPNSLWLRAIALTLRVEGPKRLPYVYGYGGVMSNAPVD
jgi:hypothetical protein